MLKSIAAKIVILVTLGTVVGAGSAALASAGVVTQAASPASAVHAVALNPQPLPPGIVRCAQYGCL